MNITLTLKQLRQLCGRTQEHVAVKMGVSQTQVSRIEKSKNNSDSVIEEFVKALGGKFEGKRAVFFTWESKVKN